MSWLDDFVKSTEKLEPPKRYFYWAGLSVIASIVKANVFLDRHSYILYPNIYVILVSSKSGLRKGIPVGYAKGVLKALDCTRLVSGQNSFPDIIHELSMQTTSKSGKTFDKAQATLCAAEFDSFILDDPKALPTLTDLYDTHQHFEDGWNKGLKHGSEFLKNPCLNILAASNEELLTDVIKTRDIKGGFMARTFVIHESKRKLKNSLMYRPNGIVAKTALAKPLERLVDLKGEFTIPDEVKDIYDGWYNNLDDNDEDPTGTMERIGDSVLKIAMLISLAKSNDLTISLETLTEAITVCEDTLPGVKRISISGKSEISPYLREVMAILIDSPNQEIARPKLLSRLNCEVEILNRVIDTLIQTEVILPPSRKPNKRGIPDGPEIYKMKPEVFEKYMEMKKNI